MHIDPNTPVLSNCMALFFARTASPAWKLLQSCLNRIKGIFSDSNSTFLWHKSYDINKNRLFPKFPLILIFHLQIMHDYVH